jgi:hypothetical protein
MWHAPAIRGPSHTNILEWYNLSRQTAVNGLWGQCSISSSVLGYTSSSWLTCNVKLQLPYKASLKCIALNPCQMAGLYSIASCSGPSSLPWLASYPYACIYALVMVKYATHSRANANIGWHNDVLISSSLHSSRSLAYTKSVCIMARKWNWTILTTWVGWARF